MPTFITRIKNLSLIRNPSYTEVKAGIGQVVYGKKIKFGTQGVYRTDDPDELKFLRSHPDLNRKKGFYEKEHIKPIVKQTKVKIREKVNA